MGSLFKTRGKETTRLSRAHGLRRNCVYLHENRGEQAMYVDVFRSRQTGNYIDKCFCFSFCYAGRRTRVYQEHTDMKGDISQ